jgi:integrase
VLGAEGMAKLVTAGSTERWRVALGLAGYAGLRLGEIRALMWGNIDFEAATISVRRSMLPDGTPKAPKTEAGERAVPLLPALRRLLVEWKLRSPHARADDLVIGTADGSRSPRGTFAACSTTRKKGSVSAQLRIAFLGTPYGTRSPRCSPPTSSCPRRRLPSSSATRTPASRLRVYARDGRDPAAVVQDVLARAGKAQVGA